MPAPIEFYFDFSSPFGYLASEKIDALAARHGRTVLWRPFLLGATFKTTGLGPLVSVPMIWTRVSCMLTENRRAPCARP